MPFCIHSIRNGQEDHYIPPAKSFDDLTNFLNFPFGEIRTGKLIKTAYKEMDISMTYKLESFIEKIVSPVICVFDGKEVEYADGKDLARHVFDRYWLAESINATDGKLILRMKENKNTNSVDWIGEEGIDRSFF